MREMFIVMLVYTWLLTSDIYLNISQNIANLNVIFNTLLTLSLKFIIATMKTSSTFRGYSMVSKKLYTLSRLSVFKDLKVVMPLSLFHIDFYGILRMLVLVDTAFRMLPTKQELRQLSLYPNLPPASTLISWP